MKLLVQPDDGVAQLVKGIEGARKSVEITIFRFDRREIERALINAVKRGVFVHALIARTNSGGEKNLRRLEMRLLEHGITVVRQWTGPVPSRYSTPSAKAIRAPPPHPRARPRVPRGPPGW